MMVKTEDGTATCREHGGRFTVDEALAHLRDEHAELFALLSGARAYRLDADDNPTQIAGPPGPVPDTSAHPSRPRNRAERRRS